MPFQEEFKDLHFGEDLGDIKPEVLKSMFDGWEKASTGYMRSVRGPYTLVEQHWKESGKFAQFHKKHRNELSVAWLIFSEDDSQVPTTHFLLYARTLKDGRIFRIQGDDIDERMKNMESLLFGHL